MKQFILKRLNQLWHQQGNLTVREQGKLLDSENPDVDIAKLAIQKGQRFFRKHVFGDTTHVEGFVANLDLAVVHKIN